jgi:anti-sigma regulatory factor (Ser/Thr protein kinase)
VSTPHASGPVEPWVASYPTVVESIACARRALARLASARGAAADKIDAIRLAVSEAMTNAVLQGDGDDGQIHIRAAASASTLAVSIDADRSQLPPLRPAGGLGAGVGLALMAHATDELAIEKRSSGGTEVRMLFGLDGR